MTRPSEGKRGAGVIDHLYLDEKTKELVVVDYKTGAFHDEYRWQLSVYGHCAGTGRALIVLPQAGDARPPLRF